MRKAKIATLILAAGAGTRMRSAYPKVLHKVCGVSLVEHLVRSFENIRVAKQVVVVGHKKDMVMHALRDMRVDFVEQKQQRGTAHAVKIAAKKFARFSGNVLIVAGDVPLFDAQLFRKFYRFHSSANRKASVLTATIDNPYGYGRIVRDDKQGICKIVEELNATLDEKNIREINSGIYLFDAQLLFSQINKIKVNKKKNEFYLTDVIELLIKQGVSVGAYCTNDADTVRGVNSREDLAVVNNVMNKENIRRLQGKGVTVIAPENTYIESGVEVGQDTVIYPFTYIEKGVKIGRDCQIGPFCKIRTGTTIRDAVVLGSFVEINRSTVKSDTSIKHLAYIGDAVVGPRANIGAGTITANYDGKSKHQSVIGEGVHTGANTVLVAPVKLGKESKTGAGAVVTAGSDVPAKKLAVGVPARIIQK